MSERCKDLVPIGGEQQFQLDPDPNGVTGSPSIVPPKLESGRIGEGSESTTLEELLLTEI